MAGKISRQELNQSLNTELDKTGDLSALSTTAKTTLVVSINEVKGNADTNKNNIGTLTNLTTTDKMTIVNAINEVQSETDTNTSNLGSLSSLTTITKNNAVSAINELDSDIGVPANLTTTAKSNLVVAINEHDSEIGTISNLKTTTKSNVVSAINENYDKTTNFSGIIVNATDNKYLGKFDGTDDSTSLQNALNDAAGRILLIPKSATFWINKTVTIPSNTYLILQGTIKLIANTSFNSSTFTEMIRIPSTTSNVVIEGTGMIDGNRANQSYAILDQSPNAIRAMGASHIVMRDVTIQNTPNSPLVFTMDTVASVGCRDCKAFGVILKNSGKTVRFEYYDTQDCELIGCTIDGIDDDSGFTFYGCHDCKIIGGTVKNSKYDGITIYNDPVANTNVYNIIVQNVHVHHNGGSGISDGSTASPMVLNTGTTIQGNIVHHNNLNNIVGGGGIRISYARGTSIMSNVVHHNGNGSNGSNGIYSNQPNTSIVGNIVYNEGQASTSGNGIALDVGMTGVISGNQIYDDQATPTTKFGVNLLGVCNALIDGNTFGNVWASGGSAMINRDRAFQVTNNQGLNPIGLLTAPSIPATGTNFTNPFSLPVRILVYGGTVSSIGIDGMAVGISSGMFMLGVGETIQLNYTAAPSWQWFGL